MIAAAFAVLAALLHAATAWRYGYFRDELYFIACSKHLAWGYVDQPPLVAVAAWLASPARYDLLALRAVPALAAALTVYVAARLAAELGGGRFSQVLAACSTLLLPAYLLLGNVLTTTSLEPLCWTLALYLMVRLIRADEVARPRLWIALAAITVLGAYTKYSTLLLAACVVLALLLTPERRVLRSRDFAMAGAIAVVALAPNIGWQAAHGWPFAQVLRGDALHRPGLQSGFALEYRDLAKNTAGFLLEQLLYTNPLAAPIWIAALVAPFRLRALRDLRFLPIAYGMATLVALAVAAKGYYIVGFYGALLAVGAVTLERATPLLRNVALGAAIAVGLAALPLSLPVLPVDALIAYTRAPHLIQPVFAEEFGWERLARDVAIVYVKLPARVQRETAIYADTYGDAGALDFFGPRYGLPPAISSQNNYYLWGTRGYSGRFLLAVGASRVDVLRRYYRRVVLVRTSTEPYKWIVEGPAPIYFCYGPVAPLPAIWPHLRWYGA